MKMAGLHDESEHTYLAHAFNLTTPFCEVNMMDDLMTVRTTSHVPISEVGSIINETTLREAIELAAGKTLLPELPNPFLSPLLHFTIKFYIFEDGGHRNRRFAASSACAAGRKWTSSGPPSKRW